MTVLDDLLELQRIDTTLDQLAYRRSHTAEHDEVASTHGALDAWEKRHGEIQSELGELTRQIRSEEVKGAELSAEQTRLEQQLRRVATPREAEALTHEIDNVKARHSDLDDAELLHLETQEGLDSELASLDGQESTLRDAVVRADAALATSLAQIDAETAAASGATREPAGGPAGVAARPIRGAAQLLRRSCDCPPQRTSLRRVPSGRVGGRGRNT